jgi:hypothetical protein
VEHKELCDLNKCRKFWGILYYLEEGVLILVNTKDGKKPNKGRVEDITGKTLVEEGDTDVKTLTVKHIGRALGSSDTLCGKYESTIEEDGLFASQEKWKARARALLHRAADESKGPFPDHLILSVGTRL